MRRYGLQGGDKFNFDRSKNSRCWITCAQAFYGLFLRRTFARSHGCVYRLKACSVDGWSVTQPTVVGSYLAFYSWYELVTILLRVFERTAHISKASLCLHLLTVSSVVVETTHVLPSGCLRVPTCPHVPVCPRVHMSLCPHVSTCPRGLRFHTWTRVPMKSCWHFSSIINRFFLSWPFGLKRFKRVCAYYYVLCKLMQEKHTHCQRPS